jgi:hypothetical protein
MLGAIRMLGLYYTTTREDRVKRGSKYIKVVVLETNCYLLAIRAGTALILVSTG